MKIKILHLVLTLDTGGLENGVVNIINGLDEERFESILCCIRHEGELIDRINKPIKIHELNHYGGITYQSIKQLREIIRSEGIDVIHTRNYEAYTFGFVAGKLLSGIRLIHSDHGRDYPFNKIKMYLQYILSLFTDDIITVSGDLKANMCKYLHINKDRINVIINGVDTEKFSPGNPDIHMLKELGISKQDIVIGTVGRLVEVKNFPELMHAFSKLHMHHKNTKLVIVGDGPLMNELIDLRKRLDLEDSIIFTGRRNDIPDLLRMFDIYALTSWNEGISNTLLEAMASALPIVASKVGGNVEIIEHDNVGYLYPSGNQEKLAESLNQLIQQPDILEHFSQNARQHVLNKYSMEAMLNNYSSEYIHVMGVEAQ